MLESFLLATPGEMLITNSNVLLAFAFAISIIALSAMAGEFMSMPSLKGFSKAELYELGVSAVILLLLAALVTPGGAFDMVGRGFMVEPSPSSIGPELCQEWKDLHGPVHYDPSSGTWYAENGNIAFGQANYFLGCKPKLSNIIYLSSGWNPLAGVPADVFPGVITSRLMKGYTSLMLTQMFTGFLSGLSTGISTPLFKVLGKDISFMIFIGLTPLNQAHTTIVDLLGTAFAAFTGQNMLLNFIEEAALTAFLPLGLMMRAFPFTRKTGSTIIAVVAAAYFVYPISILINQQIWMLIVSPPGPAGCLPAADLCSEDIDCCSFDCRGGRCAVPLTNFAEYNSIYSVCKGQFTQNKFDAIATALAGEQDKRTLEMYFSGAPTSVEPTKTEGRLNDGFGSMARRHGIAADKFTTSFLNPMPGQTERTMFSEIESLVMDAAQYAILALLFVVISIVLSLTLLKDIALLIGGEPRVFGLTKLV
jgi:hypothetical protein